MPCELVILRKTTDLVLKLLQLVHPLEILRVVTFQLYSPKGGSRAGEALAQYLVDRICLGMVSITGVFADQCPRGQLPCKQHWIHTVGHSMQFAHDGYF